MLRSSLYITYGWMSVISILFVVFSSTGVLNSSKFSWGPNPDFFLFNAPIDTWSKYIFVVCCIILNTIVRTLNQSVQKPWLYNNLQNPNVEMNREIQRYGNLVSNVDTIYTWLDWFVYINLFTSQYDMVVIEMITNMFTSQMITRYFLRIKTNFLYDKPQFDTKYGYTPLESNKKSLLNV